MNLTFALLGIAICAAWLPSVQLNSRASLPPWVACFTLSAALGVLSNVLSWSAMLALATLAATTFAAIQAPARLLRQLFAWSSAAIALAMALHLLPGFHSAKLYDGVRFSAESVPFTASMNFDKGAAGLFILAAFSPRMRRLSDTSIFAMPRLWLLVAGTPVIVIAAALITGMIRFDPKFPEGAWVFMATNLLVTCVAEEAFFRGLIQERLTRLVEHRAHLHWMPVLISTTLFAMAHWGSGAMYLALVALAGLGYSLAYAVARRIEAAIATHFALNAVHFLLFTYPLATPSTI